MSTRPSPAVGVEERKEKGDKLLAAVAEFSQRLEELGVRFAGVTVDEEMQGEDSTTLGFVGCGVGVAAGALLFQRFVEMRGNPRSIVTYSRAVVGKSGEVM